MSISNNIKLRREAAGLTQGELAEKVGVSRPMIVQIERGTKGVSVMLGVAIAEALGCKLEDLVKEDSAVS